MEISVEVPPDALPAPECNEWTINGSEWTDTWIVIYENKTPGDIMGPEKRESLLTFGAFLSVWSFILGLAVVILLLKTVDSPIKRFPQAMFLASQILLGAVVVSLTVATEFKRKWPLSKALCHVWLTCQVFIIALSSWSLLTVTVGYLLLLRWPKLYQRTSDSTKVAAALVATSLLLAISSAVLSGVLLQKPNSFLEEVCASTMTKEYALSVSLSAFIVPGSLTALLTITMLVYQICNRNPSNRNHNVYKKPECEKCSKAKTTGKVEKINYTQCPTETTNNGFEYVQVRRNSSSGSGICAVVSMLYVSLWTPFHAANLLVTSCQGFCLHPSLWSMFIWLGYSSCGIMPIVFIFCKEIRSALKMNTCKTFVT